MSRNPNLIPVKKLITRGGSPFVTTVWVSPEEYKEIKSQSKSTDEMYKVGGKYTAERKKEHKRIVTNVVNSCPKPLPGKAPIAILLLGGAASGKSTVVNKFIKPNAGTDFGTINADDIKESIPEYKSMMGHDVETAAARVHEESSEIGKAATRAVIDQKRNFIYDAVLGNEEKAKKLIADLKSKGYRISLVGVNVDAEAAVDRAESRAFGDGKGKGGSGRFVPSKILLGGHKGSSSTFEAIKGLVDNVELYDNNVPFGDTPIKVVDGDKILDQKRYDSFKSKASINVDEILNRRSKQNIQKSLDAMGISKGVETPINSNKTNLSVSSEDYYGSDIYKGLYQDDLEKDLRKAELGEKPAQEEVKEPTIEQAHADEMKKKDLDREYQAKQDKKFTYGSLTKDEQRALKVLVNIDGKSAREKIEGVMNQYNVSKMGAINILADATKQRDEEGEKAEKKEGKKEDTVEKGEDQIPGGKGDNARPSDFNNKELDMGIKTEMEHTNDRNKAQEIALDHLKEDPKYYSKLKASGLADELNDKKKDLQKAFDFITDPDFLEKGKKMPIGTVTNGVKKVAEGKWVPVKKDGSNRRSGEVPSPEDTAKRMSAGGKTHYVHENPSGEGEVHATQEDVDWMIANDREPKNLRKFTDGKEVSSNSGSGGTLKVEKEKDGKFRWTMTFDSGHSQKWDTGFDTKADAIRDYQYRSKHIKDKGNLQKALDDLLEKAKGSLDPNGKWVTIDGRHVHLNSRGDVDAGKIYGKDNKDSKDQTTNSGGKNQGGKDLKAQVKAAKEEHKNTSFADPKKNETHAKLRELQAKLKENIDGHKVSRQDYPSGKPAIRVQGPDGKVSMTPAGDKSNKDAVEAHKNGGGTSDTPTMDTFKKLASESKDVNDFMAKVREIKNVPASVADEFQSKYGAGSQTITGASQKFMDEHGKKPDAPKVKDSWYAENLSKRIDDLKEGLKKVEKYPDDFKETSGGGRRTKKEIISDFNDHIKMNQDKLDRERESNAKQEAALSKFKREKQLKLYDSKSNAYIEGEIAHTERSARAFAREGDTANEKDRKDHVKDLRDILAKREYSDRARKNTASEEAKNSPQMDLFEDYDKQPKELSSIVDKYAQKYEDGEMDYKDTAKYLKEVEALGYTFDYGLDNIPTDLRKKSGGRTKPSNERRGLNSGATRIV